MKNKGTVTTLTDSYVEVKCPHCRHTSIYDRKSTDEGKYRKLCQVCGNAIKYEVNKSELFRGDGVGGIQTNTY